MEVILTNLGARFSSPTELRMSLSGCSELLQEYVAEYLLSMVEDM